MPYTKRSVSRNSLQIEDLLAWTNNVVHATMPPSSHVGVRLGILTPRGARPASKSYRKSLDHFSASCLPFGRDAANQIKATTDASLVWLDPC